MAIKQLDKITLYGPIQDKAYVLQGLQALGCMHLIPLTDQTAEPSVRMQPARASEALAWLERAPRTRRQVKDKSAADIDSIVREVLDNKSATREVSDARDKLEERIREVRPWGEFTFPDLSEMARQRLWFYTLPQSKMSALDDIELPWQIMAQDNKQKLVYVILVSEQEPVEDLLPVSRTHVGIVPLSRLEEELEESEQLLEDLFAEREALTRWNYLLGQAVAAKQDAAELAEAQSGTRDEEEFFLIQGWMPVSERKETEIFCLENGVAAIFEEPSEDDHPPTLLEKLPVPVVALTPWFFSRHQTTARGIRVT